MTCQIRKLNYSFNKNRLVLFVTVTMSKPDVRINNLVKERFYADPISKFFIVTEMIFGLNRLLLLDNINTFFILLGYAYSVVVTVMFYYITFNYVLWEAYPLSTITDISSFFISIVLSPILWKRLRNFYIQLSLFDTKVGCEIKLSSRSIVNLIQSVFSLMCAFSIFAYSLTLPNSLSWFGFVSMPMKLLHTFDLNFCSHLLSLLIPRLQILNYYLESTYPNVEISKRYRLDKAVKIKQRSLKRAEINMIIDFYNELIRVYDILNNAIKWQMLFMFIETFVIALRDLYYISIQLLARQFETNGMLIMANIMTVRFVPMLSVCATGDTLHKEVLRLREMLACRLYEGRLDECDRRPAKALLTLTEARNLSFSLFHMFNIDISLPFKIFSLLITYLIILLQFEKVNRNSLQV